MTGENETTVPLLLTADKVQALLELLEQGRAAIALQAVKEKLEQAREDLDAYENSIDAARSNYADGSDDDVEIDDIPVLSPSDKGVWVGAWVWVPNGDEE